MLKGVYTMYDKKAGLYANLSVFDNDDLAIREFASMIMAASASSIFKTHSNDFELYKIGVYDLESAKIESVNMVYLCSGGDFDA